MRVVLDTNVLLAGLATHGLCEALVLLMMRDHEVVLCDHILDELHEHYTGRFGASAAQADLVVETLRTHAQIVEPIEVSKSAFNDPDDLPVLGAAVAGRVACLVTGDKALLALGEFEDVAILSPREAYDRVRQ